MNSIINKTYKQALLIWLASICILVIYNKNSFLVVPLLLGSISAFILACSNRRIVAILSIAIFTLSYILAIYLRQENLFVNMHLEYIGIFTSLIIYINSHRHTSKGITYSNIGYYLVFLSLSILLNVDICLIVLISIMTVFLYLVSRNEEDLFTTKDKYYAYYSNSKDQEKNLKNLYKDVISEQDEKIKNAILNERNRISRDIHDSLGHLTSRGILQIGAMMVVEKDPQKKEQLSMLKSTLQEGMNEVRKSLHNFQNETVDLRAELDKILADFTFCPLSFSYSLESEMDLKSKYTIIYIIKESLTNIVKHSNADLAEISIIESFDKIYIKIFDNGRISNIDADGMGLFSIRKRVNDLKGQIEISADNGFRIFITLDKERK